MKWMTLIRHFFLLCAKVAKFWRSVLLWWNRISEIKIAIDLTDLEENILFGFQLDDKTFHVLNYCVLIAKHYIYCQRLFHENDVNLYEFLCKLKQKLVMEENINYKNNTRDFEKFRFVYNCL
eukprot:GHVU01075431.1.p2 GENE.GHVU01075431.1~~GHVU01075431.1.p2  ORF type:complete len:122 (+),score=9.42 GHVU01075431.1:441-806(+)